MIKGNLYSVEFFYHLEKDGAKDFFTKEEITLAIKKGIETSQPKKQKVTK